MFFIILFFSVFSFSAIAESDCESLYLDVHKSFVLLLEAEKQEKETQDRLADAPKDYASNVKNVVLLLEAEKQVKQAQDRLENSKAVYIRECSDQPLPGT